MPLRSGPAKRFMEAAVLRAEAPNYVATRERPVRGQEGRAW
jgi:hypothetical protein